MFRPDKGRKASKTSYQVRKQHVVSEREGLFHRGKHSKKSISPSSVSRISSGLEDDEIEPMSPENKDSEYASDGDSLASSKRRKRNSISSARSSTDASFSSEADSGRVSEAASAKSLHLSESPIQGEESDAASSSNSKNRSSAKKRKVRSLSSSFRSSLRKSLKSSLPNVQEVASGDEEDSPAARDASRANMSSDFASSGVDSNPSSPMPEHRDRATRSQESDLSSSSGDSPAIDAHDSSQPNPSQVVQRKNKRRRRNY